jgi:8-oxo-dGTP diphosphatase
MNLYCSNCGNELTEAPVGGRQRMVCPACLRVAYRRLKVGAGAQITRDGKLLLLQRGWGDDAFPGTWNLPAGYCEGDEAPSLAARREAAEEAGLQIRTGRLAGAHFFDDDPRGNGILLVYEAEIVAGELRCDGREIQSAAFFSADALPASLCGGGHDEAIIAWQRRALDRWQPGMEPRYCPHCSQPLAERLSFRRMRFTCSQCGYVHFREAKVGVTALIEREGKVLLVRRGIEPGLGRWSLPSGFVDWDESPESALVRECAEETGLVIENPVLWQAQHYTDDCRGPGVNLIYRAEVAGGRLQAGDDASAARFYDRDELPLGEEIAFKGHRHTLELWLDSKTEGATNPTR